MKEIIKVNAAGMMGAVDGYDVYYINATNEMLVGERKYYDNKGHFYGKPIFRVKPDDFPNVRPAKLFNMLHGNNSFLMQLTGVVDWDSREEYLACFTPEERQKACEIESYIEFIHAYNK